MTAAEAGPPTRLCNMNMMLSSTTGNTASMPLPAGPSWKLNVTTTPTRRATSPARSARSVHRGRNPLTRTWRNGRTSTRHTLNTATLMIAAAVKFQSALCTTTASTSQARKPTLMLTARDCVCASRTYVTAKITLTVLMTRLASAPCAIKCAS
jgi:hypothetical protein